MLGQKEKGIIMYVSRERERHRERARETEIGWMKKQ